VDPIEQAYFQAGVYDGNPDTSFSGTRVKLSKEEGALAYFEAGYRLNQRKSDTGLPGNYKLGTYFHTGDFSDVYDTIAGAFGLTPGTQPPHPNNYGWYFLAEQMLYREKSKEDPAQQGMVGFFRVAGAPADRNLAQFGVDGGLVYKGLIPKRDWDTLAIAGSYLEISDDIRRAQQAANTVLPGAFVVSDYESVIEVSYKAQMTAWWTVQPSVQRVFHPGGSSAIPDAWAVIVMSSLRF
jgi:porin